MNAKHYVSLEVAKLLKEKGYNEECYLYYKKEDPALYYRELYNRNSERDDIISCPSLLEAMDWLEERGIRISIKYDWIECGWYYIVIDGTPTIKNITEVEKSDGIFYKDRNECMNAAIKKGLEYVE